MSIGEGLNAGSIYCTIVVRTDEAKRTLLDFAHTVEATSLYSETFFAKMRDGLKDTSTITPTMLALGPDALKKLAAGNLLNKNAVLQLQDFSAKTKELTANLYNLSTVGLPKKTNMGMNPATIALDTLGTEHPRGTVGNMPEQLETMHEKLIALKDTAHSASSAIAAIGAVGIGKYADDYIDRSTANLEKAMGNGEKAKQLTAELKKVPTSISLDQLNDAARKLLAYGMATKDIIPIITDVGDAVAGTGGGLTMFKRTNEALGQMFAKQKVSAEEMNQLANAGLASWDYLAKSMGKPSTDVMKIAKEGFIPAEQAINAIRAGIHADYGGMMQLQAKTNHPLTPTPQLKDAFSAGMSLYNNLAGMKTLDKGEGRTQGALAGLSAAALIPGAGIPLSAGLALIGGLLGGSEAAKRAAEEAARQRAAMIGELRKLSNQLLPISDYFRQGMFSGLTSRMTWGGLGLADSLAAQTARGAY